MKTIVEIGGEKEKGKKTIVLEDMYPLFKKAKDSKDTGGIHDFVEILKLYDKNSDKTMLSKDLFRLLTNLGNFCFIVDVLLTGSNNQFWKYEFAFFNEMFDQLQQGLQFFIAHGRRKQFDWQRTLGFVISESVVGSGEQYK